MLTLNLTEVKSFPDLYTSSYWLTHCVNTESLGDLLCTKGCLVRTSRYSIDEVSYVSLNCKAQEEVLSRTCLRLCMQVLCRAARSAQATLSTLLGNVVSKSHVLHSCYTYIYSQYTLHHIIGVSTWSSPCAPWACTARGTPGAASPQPPRWPPRSCW